MRPSFPGLAERHRLAFTLCALLWLVPTQGAAHGPRIPIFKWGGWTGDLATCQRTIGKAAAACGLQAWRLRATCLAAQAGGRTCDTDATDAAIGAAHDAAIAMVEAVCTPDQVQTLGFSRLLDVDADIDVACQRVERGTASAVFRPALSVDGTAHAADGASAICIAAAQRAAGLVVDCSLHHRRQALDFIAFHELGAGTKVATIDLGTARIARRRTAAAAEMARTCGADAFARVYGQDPAFFLAVVGQLGDCVASDTYVQDAVLCPTAMCGDGMIEVPEQCDDGNTASGDGCDATCKLE